MNNGAPGTERNKGYKSRIYTDIRQKINKMNREEWRMWFDECIQNLQKDEALWDWLTKERKYEGRTKGGVYQRKLGRPFDSRKKDLPDTRNTNHELE